MKKKIRFILRVAMLMYVLWCSYYTMINGFSTREMTVVYFLIMMVGWLGILGILIFILFLITKAVEWIWSDK